MKLEEVKNKEEFFKIANNWYHRAHRLRVVWQNPDIPLEERERAHNLYDRMCSRLISLVPIANKINMSSINFPSGGIVN